MSASPFIYQYMKNNASELVASAIVSSDSVTIFVGGKGYRIHPPTIRRIAGAGVYLSRMTPGETIRDTLCMMAEIGNLAHALSWFIAGDESLADELSEASFDEVLNGVLAAYSLLSTENFTKLSVLVRNVQKLIANPKQ